VPRHNEIEKSSIVWSEFFEMAAESKMAATMFYDLKIRKMKVFPPF
jgi:hypothetical protein